MTRDEEAEARRVRRAAYAWCARAIAASAALAPERPRVDCQCGEADGHTGPHSASACLRVTRGGRVLNVCGSCTLSEDTNRVWLDDEWANRPASDDGGLAVEIERIRLAMEAAGAVTDEAPESAQTANVAPGTTNGAVASADGGSPF